MGTRPGIYSAIGKAGVVLGALGLALWLVSYKV